MQGAWTKWDSAMSLDLSWNNLIYTLPPKLLSFALNATQMTLPTPDRLRVWNYTQLSKCGLCSHPRSSLFHILCNCRFSIQNKRFEWRHDSVLRTVARVIFARLKNQNSKPPRPRNTNEIKFVRAGSKPPTTREMMLVLVSSPAQMTGNASLTIPRNTFYFHRRSLLLTRDQT